MAAYNRYHGNSGRVERIREPEPSAAAPPVISVPTGAASDTSVPAGRPAEQQHEPPNPPPAPGGELGRLLQRLLPMRLETEDLLLITLLYLLYRESGDRDFLIMIGGILVL
ncbi:MAG: hypothetical protein LUC06_02435 [Oscillospiraceae bacterium]|nr:hypothetical protein [Oscillospiraceae bacterium]